MARSLKTFKYLSFDVVGTLIDFEEGLVDCLGGIAAEAGVAFDGEAALALYRAARYEPEALRFPDDLARVYGRIAPKLDLPQDPALGVRLRESARTWKAFPDSAAALASLAKRYRLIAMTNAQRWAYDCFAATLGDPFFAGFTTDDTGTEKPDPAFFETVFAFVEGRGDDRADILHVAQSQYHDIGVSRALGMTNCWIERRHDKPGWGGTIAPEHVTTPDYHFHTLADLAAAVERSFAA